MTRLQQLNAFLDSSQFEGHRFHCMPIQGDHSVLRVEVEHLNDPPIFVTHTDTQILCIAYLAHRAEIRDDRETQLNALLLELNVPMPLSAFALVENYYVAFGALALDSDTHLIATELVTLAENAQQALLAFEPYLR
ncbi:DUF2170 family protein [Reinekea blandensis]|nr:DUF2170 family protein [Reinekea blandensis]